VHALALVLRYELTLVPAEAEVGEVLELAELAVAEQAANKVNGSQVPASFGRSSPLGSYDAAVSDSDESRAGDKHAIGWHPR
jgi:hypothetical protein